MLPDAGVGTSANDDDDPDNDGVPNLLEYSQGMNPTESDSQLAPKGQKSSEGYRYDFRKDGISLSYNVYYTNQDYLVDGWSFADTGEQADSNGNYWYDFDLSNDTKFLGALEVDVADQLGILKKSELY